MVIDDINKALATAETITPSRELSLVKTKLEEAVMWAERGERMNVQRHEAMRPQQSKGQR